MDRSVRAPDSHAFFADMPKAELHLHIEGTLTPARMLDLAERNGVALPYADEAAIEAAYAFDSLQSFLDLYYQGMAVLQSEADFYDLAMDYLAVCRQENILHTEIGFDPQGHTERGLDFGVAYNGIRRAMEDARSAWGLSSLLIMNILRHLPASNAAQCMQQAMPYADGITAIGLDSSEVGFPPEPFAAVFEQARRSGWRCVAHAGEEGPPAYVWGALDALRVDRVDHGIRAEEDPKLMARLREAQIPLTVCPLSNVRLCAVERMADHNLLRLLRAGLLVTVNSDDPSYFGGYLSENFRALAADVGLTVGEAADLARNSFRASFLSPAQQAPLLTAVDNWLEGLPG